MALRWKAYAPNTILKAVEVQDLADNGVIQLDTAADLASADLVNANVVYVVAEAKPYVRQAAGVGADKWQVFSGGLSGLGGWADITATTGSPTKHEYTDSDGNDWTAYEFTGDGTITTTDGVADCLVVGGGAKSYAASSEGSGGGVMIGLQASPSGTHTVTVGVGGNSPRDGSGSQFLAQIGSASSDNANSKGAGAVNSTKGIPEYWQGVHSSITGTDIEYGAGNRAGLTTPGCASNGTGHDGVVIIRVPRPNAKA